MQNQSRLLNFVVESKLGEGSFSCVYKVRKIDDGQYYAMKKVKIGQMKEKQRQNALNQVRILASITHPNIVNYRQAFFDDKTQTLCIVMQLADAGDIQKKINQHLRLGTHFNQSQIWQALIQMTRGLKALHQINILHRDLKCANVFCTSDRCYKLGDLNVSKVAKRGMARTQTGTPYYTSPQVWNDRPYDAKCDIWSLGCVVYQMATLRPPFRANNLKELYGKIQKGIYQPVPRFYSEDLRSVVSQCLKVLPSQRISAIELLNNSVVLRNMPANQVNHQNNNQSNKCSLLKTILVPKNLKSLKQALPGSKYQQPKKLDVEGKVRRANSANNIRDIPQVIQSPKMGENHSELLKYAFMRRPSQQPKRQMHSQRQDQVKVIPRMERNNSIDFVRKRVDSNQSIENSRRNRDNSRQIKQSSKELPRVSSKEKIEILRPPSQGNNRMGIRQIRDSSRNSRDVPYSSRQRAHSRDGSRQGKQKMQEINVRCRQIEARVKALMDRKRDEKEQRNPNLPSIKQPYINPKEMKYNYQRPVSRQRQLSRNKSIELARQQAQSLKQNQSKKNLERPPSRDRLASLERNNSHQRRPGGLRYNY